MIEWERLEVSSRKLDIPRENFYAKMDTIKDRNRKKLIEEEEIKKKWQEHTEGLYIKGLKDADNHDDVVSHLQPDILGYEVR